MCSRPEFTDLTYMGGTRACAQDPSLWGVQSPMDRFWLCYLELVYNLNIKFGVNRTFHVLKTIVYRFELYGRYRTLWTDDDNFWLCYLEWVYKPKYQIWCESHVQSAQDPSLPI